ncbi:hypothetical protein B0H34DRAFT_666447, partial [Crassisporium funariophilum]
MPTATTTYTKTASLPLKATLIPPSPPPISSLPPPTTTKTAAAHPQTSHAQAATLRSLYARAARAFVLRDVSLTSSLLHSAFALLHAPVIGVGAGDGGEGGGMEEWRRKWDILRITFESTVYASPPPPSSSSSSSGSGSGAGDGYPEALRAMMTESPQALATSIYTRSLALFTPSHPHPHSSISGSGSGSGSGTFQKQKSMQVLNAAYLPTQVLTTLVYSCLKIDAPDVGRVVIEDWLARREPRYSSSVDGGEEEGREGEGEGGYAKVLDLYVLHVLPKLEQWDYAKEFLDYESELPQDRRE